MHRIGQECILGAQTGRPTVRALVALAVAGLTGLTAAPARAEIPPTFGVRDVAQVFKKYTLPDGGGSVSDAYVQATVTPVAAGQWILTLTAKKDLVEMWFPWVPDQHILNPDQEDDVFYCAPMLGAAAKASVVGEWAWGGSDYPGPLHAPLTVLADPHKAWLVAATNWPPRHVKIWYSKNRIICKYVTPQATGTTRTYGCISQEFTGDAAAGNIPWQAALDRYRAWLIPNMQAEGLYPIPYSEKLRSLNGWLSFHLAGQRRFDLEELYAYYEYWRPYFDWIQLWGQMSNYAGPRDWARPPVRAAEKTGCCVARRELHDRYLPGILDFVEHAKSQGSRVGFYVRPRDGFTKYRLDDPAVIDGETHLEWLLKWIHRNREDYGANGVYVDTLGNYMFGEGLFMADLIRDELGFDAVVEGADDFYPCAAMVSGTIASTGWPSGPDVTIEGLGQGYDSMIYPQFGRYLLNDKIIFIGGNNGDSKMWGIEHDHWVERQAFLLGAKIDAMEPYASDLTKFGELNPALAMIIGEWNKVGWWARWPAYMDRNGVSAVPAGIDVRRFRDKTGQDLFVIDNWQQLSGKTFKYLGQPIAIPTQRLSIVVKP
jgi:hypothetical protein